MICGGPGGRALHSLTIIVGIDLRINNIKYEIKSYGNTFCRNLNRVQCLLIFLAQYGRFNSQTTRPATPLSILTI